MISQSVAQVMDQHCEGQCKDGSRPLWTTEDKLCTACSYCKLRDKFELHQAIIKAWRAGMVSGSHGE